jgi:hypothetical protein
VPRHRKKAIGSLPPLLVRLIHAAGRDGRPDMAQALAAYGEYALVAVPTRGGSHGTPAHWTPSWNGSGGAILVCQKLGGTSCIRSGR